MRREYNLFVARKGVCRAFVRLIRGSRPVTRHLPKLRTAARALSLSRTMDLTDPTVYGISLQKMLKHGMRLPIRPTFIKVDSKGGRRVRVIIEGDFLP